MINGLIFNVVNYLGASPRGIEGKCKFDFNASVGAFKSRLLSKYEYPLQDVVD